MDIDIEDGDIDMILDPKSKEDRRFHTSFGFNSMGIAGCVSSVPLGIENVYIYYIYMHIYVYIYNICVHACMYVCIYIFFFYLYINMHIHTHLYSYMCVQTLR
jgi:hypothetical protein